MLHDQATFTATVENGKVSEVKVDFPGSGYVPGEEYTVVFSEPTRDPEDPTDPNVAAKGIATADKNGKITQVTILEGGNGYDRTPSVSLDALPERRSRSTLELSENATRSGYVFATFEVRDQRNDVAFNGTGVALEGSAVRIVKTDVRESLGTGILVSGLRVWDPEKVDSSVLEQPVIEIGGLGVSAERTWSAPDERNVAVFANRGAGIVLEQKVFEEIGKAILGEDFTEAGNLTREDRDALRDKFASYLLIAGNYLGENTAGEEAQANGTGVVQNFGKASLSRKAAAFADAVFGGAEGNDLREDHDIDGGENEAQRPVLPEDFVSLQRYRALFRPEDFEASTDVFTFDPEIGELDPRILLDRVKIQELETISGRDSLANLHGTVPKYQAGDDNPDDPVGGGGSGNNPDDGSGGGNWWDYWPTLR